MPSAAPTRRRTYTHRRAAPQDKWVNAPLQNEIRDALNRKEWTISDLARAIGSQPSLVSRWMMGQRPNTESIGLIAYHLGLDEMYLMRLAGHIAADMDADADDPDLRNLVAKLRTVPLTDERRAFLHGIFETMLKTPLPPTERPRREDRDERVA